MRTSPLAVWLLAAAACSHDAGGPSTIGLGDPVVPSGESGDIVITVHRTGTSAVSVPFTTRDDSATADSDYVGASGTIEWADGDTEDKTISVSIMDDVVIESSESLVIELGEPTSGGSVDKGSVSATILDDDHPGDSFAVTSKGRLMHFDKAEPGRFSWAVDLSGLGSDEVIALDMRPTDGLLYGLTSSAKLYTIDPMTGAATLKSTLAADPADTTSPFTGLSGAELGIDFNPVLDRLRITSNIGQNLRVDVDTGLVTTDKPISGLSSGYSAIAHSNDIVTACKTTLYAIDAVTGRILDQNSVTGTTVGVGGLGFNGASSAGFDIVTDADGNTTALAILRTGGQAGMYSLDLSSGKTQLERANVGPLAEGEAVKSFALTPLPAATPATQRDGELYGVTATGVISFTRANPEKLCTAKPITGLAANETILDVDMRPSTGVLYVLTAIGNAGKLHRLDPTSGTMSPAIPISVPLQGTAFGMDFSPTGAVPLRIVSNAGQNLRVNDLTTGAASADTALNGAGTIATGAGYTDSVQGAGTATLYVIDEASDHLRIQSPPNSGTLVDVGALGIDLVNVSGFDIDGRDNLAFIATTTGASSALYTMNVATGAVSGPLGTIGGGAPVRGITRATPLTNLIGVTTDGKLVRISMTDPSNVTVIYDAMAINPVDTITGMAPGEYLMGIDFRPGGGLYGITNLGAMYSVNSSVASANKQGMLAADPTDTSSPFTALSGGAFDVDFDPSGVMRIVSDTEQNLRIPNVATPKVITDAPLSSPTPDPINVTAAAYTNSFVPSTGGTPSTTLYVIDVASGQLMTGSGNSGTCSVVGPLSSPADAVSGFDIAGGNNGIAVAAVQRSNEAFSRLYRIDLATGAATEIGNRIGGAALRSIAVQVR